jgi:hypothetical protein
MVSTTVETIDVETVKEAENIAQVAGFLQQHEEVEMIIPVLFGVYVTSQLQLRGLNALLVNLAVASVFRSVFKQLKNPTAIITPPSSATTPQNSQTNTQSPPTDLFGEGVTIVHSVPGRIRLRIEQLNKDVAFGKRLARLLDHEDCVISTRINPTASSIVINYDSEGLSDLDLGFKLMNILNHAKTSEST